MTPWHQHVISRGSSWHNIAILNSSGANGSITNTQTTLNSHSSRQTRDYCNFWCSVCVWFVQRFTELLPDQEWMTANLIWHANIFFNQWSINPRVMTMKMSVKEGNVWPCHKKQGCLMKPRRRKTLTESIGLPCLSNHKTSVLMRSQKSTVCLTIITYYYYLLSVHINVPWQNPHIKIL